MKCCCEGEAGVSGREGESGAEVATTRDFAVTAVFLDPVEIKMLKFHLMIENFKQKFWLNKDIITSFDLGGQT